MIKKKILKAALGLAVLALFIMPNANLAQALALDNTQIATKDSNGDAEDFDSATHTPNINAGSPPATSYSLFLNGSEFLAGTTIEIGDFTLTGGNASVSANAGNVGFTAGSSVNVANVNVKATNVNLTGGTANGTYTGGYVTVIFADLEVTGKLTMKGNDAAKITTNHMRLEVEKLTIGKGLEIVGSSGNSQTDIYVKNGTDVTGDFNLTSVDSTTNTTINYFMDNATVTDNVLDVKGDILLTGSQNAGSIVLGAGTSNISVKSTGNLELNALGGNTNLAVGLGNGTTNTTEVLDVGGDVILKAGGTSATPAGNTAISGTTGSNFKAHIGGNLKITTYGSGNAVFSYATITDADKIVNIVGNVYIENGSIIGNSLASFQHGTTVNIGGDVTIKSLDTATSTDTLAASFVAHGNGGKDNFFGGNITLINEATTGVNNTHMLLSTVGKNIIDGNLTVTSTGIVNIASTAAFNANTASSITQINGGSLIITGISGALITHTKASFSTLDFSDSQGANVKVTDGTLRLTNLTLAGGKANNFTFLNFDTEMLFPSTPKVLTVGNENFTGNGGTLNIISAAASTKPLDFSNAAFYLNGLAGGDVALTVTGLSNNVKTAMVDVSVVNAGNVMLALTGNNLKAGETLTLITGDIIGGTVGGIAGTPTAISTTNIINNLNPGLYNVGDYLVHWDANNNLILSLSATPTANPYGAIGGNTPNIWFKDLEKLASTNPNPDFLTSDNLASLDGANNPVDAYNALSPNAKELYKDLAFKTDETGFDDYKWVDNSSDAIDSRQKLDEYFGVVVPQLVTDYNATHGNQVSKDDYIIAFMNDLDPFIHTVGGLHISRVVVDSMDIILDNANTTNSSLAYAQSVAAGENTDYWRIWAKTSATWDKLANQGFYSGYTGSHFAGYLGGDRNFGNARLGLAIGAGKSKLDWDNNAKTEADNIIAKLYGEYDYNSFTFGASIGGGNTSVEAERYVAGTKRKADYDVSMFAFDVYSKYSHKTENFEFTPEIGLSYLKTKQDSFTERGAAGMYFDSLKNDSALAYLKVSANVPVELENGIILKPRASAGISHELADNNSTLRSSFIGQPGQFVNNKGPELKRTSVDVGVGLEANFTNDLSAYVQYDAQIQSDYKRQTASAGLEFRF